MPRLARPGGPVQALLEHDLHVLGIDPAEMDETVASDRRFTHIENGPQMSNAASSGK